MRRFPGEDQNSVAGMEMRLVSCWFDLVPRQLRGINVLILGSLSSTPAAGIGISIVRLSINLAERCEGYMMSMCRRGRVRTDILLRRDASRVWVFHILERVGGFESGRCDV